MKAQPHQRKNRLQQLSILITRRWLEKLAALVLAFFFWNMIKQQIRSPHVRESEFIREHSIQDAAGLGK